MAGGSIGLYESIVLHGELAKSITCWKPSASLAGTWLQRDTRARLAFPLLRGQKPRLWT